MRRKINLALLMIALMGIGNLCQAQKQEINAFKEMNSKLLKEVKKQYKKEPTVELKDNVFFIVVEGKVNKKKMLMVLNEDGELLTPEPVASYAPLSDDKNYVCYAVNYGNNAQAGIVSYRNGQSILQPKYTQITISHGHEAGIGNSGVWRDAAVDGWVAYDPVADETVFLSIDGKNLLNRASGPYRIKNGDYIEVGRNNRNGLYTMNGRELFPQLYSSYTISKDGFVITSVFNAQGNLRYGGKTINPNSTQYAFKNELLGLKVENGVPHYKVHRDDEWTSYASQPVYTASYIDDGQKHYDNGDYDKVIAFYEGEGIDAPHAGYYMGMASKAIGDEELAKLDKTISTLKNPQTYYYPVANPENYTINGHLLGSQFTLAQNYFDTYLKNNEGNPDDPRVKKAKKHRGEAAVARNSVARKLDDYTSLYTAAAKKYAVEQTNAQIERARQEAVSNSIATGLTNLLFGK